MSGWAVVLLVLVAWFVLSVVAGLLIGRVIRVGQAEPTGVKGRGAGPGALRPHRAPIGTKRQRAGKHQARSRGQLAG